MAQNSLAPAFIQIQYTSLFGLHTMTIPSVPFIQVPATGQWRFDLRGGAVDETPLSTGIDDFLNVVREYFDNTTVFANYTAFTQTDAAAQPIPVETGTLGKVGVFESGAGGWTKAVQTTLTWRTDTFGLYKLVMLDSVTGNNFDRKSGLPVGSRRKIVSDYITSQFTWLAGRDGGRPVTFLQEAVTLNEKLRKSYRMQ